MGCAHNYKRLVHTKKGNYSIPKYIIQLLRLYLLAFDSCLYGCMCSFEPLKNYVHCVFLPCQEKAAMERQQEERMQASSTKHFMHSMLVSDNQSKADELSALRTEIKQRVDAIVSAAVVCNGMATSHIFCFCFCLLMRLASLMVDLFHSLLCTKI